jgi:vesicle-fusing ATPase
LYSQRRWASIELDRPYQIRPYVFDKNVQSIATLILEVDFLNKKRYFFSNRLYPSTRFAIFSTTTDPYDTDKMAVEFLQQYTDHAFSVGQSVCNE